MFYLQLVAGVSGLFPVINSLVVPRPDPKHVAPLAIALLAFVSLTAIVAAWALLRQRTWGHFLNVPWIFLITMIVAVCVKQYTIGISGVWTYTPTLWVERGVIVLVGVIHLFHEVLEGFKVRGKNQELLV
jgi:hypothetical protein